MVTTHVLLQTNVNKNKLLRFLVVSKQQKLILTIKKRELTDTEHCFYCNQTLDTRLSPILHNSPVQPGAQLQV